LRLGTRFAFCVLAAAWLTILITPQRTLRARAQEEDFGRTVIFVFVVVAACASLFAVGFLVSVGSGQAGHLVLGLATVVLSWSLIQTVFGLHYAMRFMAIAINQAKGNMLADSFSLENGCRITSILPTFRSL